MADEGLVPAKDPVLREREELSGRLRMLREATGKSQREFAEVLNVDHSTVSVYEKPDGRVPDLEYIDGFLEEVAIRADVTAEVLADTREVYGRVLQLLCDRPQERGRTHGYRQMLRVYELTLEREALTTELNNVRRQQQDVADELARLQDANAQTAVDSERQQQLEETVATLGQRRAELARRRETVVSDLDASQAQLRQFRIPPPERNLPAVWSGGPPQQPPAPLPRSTGRPPHSPTRALVIGAVVITVLGGWLIYRVTGSGHTREPSASRATNPGPSVSNPGPSADPKPSHSARPPQRTTPTVDPLRALPDPCLAVSSSLMSQYHLQGPTAVQDARNKDCIWDFNDANDGDITLEYRLDPGASHETGDGAPTTVKGVSQAFEIRSGDQCIITWYTSFGLINLVDRSGDFNQCHAFADAVAPKIPK